MPVTYTRDQDEPLIDGMIRVEPLRYLYSMPHRIETEIRELPFHFGYGGFSESVFNRTYARIKPDGSKESFPDVVVRVVNGCLSIRKDWYIKHGLVWNNNEWNEIALKMGKTFMGMKALPSGRGLWTCGTTFGNTKGASAFNNCGFCSVREGFSKAASWTMNALMSGCGIGFDTVHTDEFDNINVPGCEVCSYDKILDNCGCKKLVYTIHDSREGWVKSLKILIDSYMNGQNEVVHFDYTSIREKGTPIKGFGGSASGPLPLIELHQRIRAFFECFCETRNNLSGKTAAAIRMVERMKDLIPETNELMINSANSAIDKIKIIDPNLRQYSATRLIIDVFNAIGICVVAGNVRRSSEICIGEVGDEDFLNLKNYDIYPERSMIGWMSNNTVVLKNSGDFSYIPRIVERIKDNGEPGILNMINVSRSGRVGAYNPIRREAERDDAIGINPCLTGDTQIFTYTGLFTINELVGRGFMTVEGYQSTEQGFWSNGVKEVYRITLENGMSIKATKNHKFLCLKEDICWSEVQNLEVNTKMCLYKRYSNHQVDGDQLDYLYEGYHVNKELINIEDNYFYSSIISIEWVGEEEVFDCSIPGLNRFVANGMISHNCGEIPLESFEYCNLAEVFPSRCENFEEFKEAAEMATIYTSTISLLPSDSADTNRVVAKNRRIGVSISGIAEIYHKHSYCQMIEWFKEIYRLVRRTNEQLANEAGIRSAIRTTTVKPSGTLSQLVGVSSGIHFPTYEYCIRRMRIDNQSDVLHLLRNAGYKIEPEFNSPETTSVVEFPLHQSGTRTSDSVSMWEQSELQMSIQRHYSDNAVSCTIYFNPEIEAKDLEYCIAMLVPNIKSVSALPHTPEGKYAQMPYEKITQEQYEEMSRKISPVVWSNTKEDSIATKGCDSGACEFRPRKRKITEIDDKVAVVK